MADGRGGGSGLSRKTVKRPGDEVGQKPRSGPGVPEYPVSLVHSSSCVIAIIFLFTNIDVTFLLIFKCANHGTKEVIVLTAN